MKRIVVAMVGGLVGGVAWLLGMNVFFGPAQAILADPKYQSEKFLHVVLELEPVTRSIEDPSVMVWGLAAIGVIYGLVFHFIGTRLTGGSVSQGLKFGALAWALMTPWFEFYLPWNVMHEPLGLVLIESALWLLVLLLVGLTIAFTYNTLLRMKTLPAH